MASSTMFDEAIKVHVFVANICTSLVEFQIYMILCVCVDLPFIEPLEAVLL